MKNDQSKTNKNYTLKFHRLIDILKKNASLSEKDINIIIANIIVDYLVGKIGVLELLEFVDALRACLKSEPQFARVR
ncbi:hypothetical protein HZA75_07125 [Candidatus Roizmanbacteria bacterium]|nr:hypothetical protein [Candidatus Roizmanbacteria bacterium]